jgi:predicted outer membrane protein
VALRKSALALLLLSALAIGCSKEEAEDKPVLTQREKDSIFAQSTMIGAKAVKHAMRTADSASARQYGLDSAEKEP